MGDVPDTSEEWFASRLAAFDEALAAGRAEVRPPNATLTIVDDEFERAKDCLRRLERAWSRRHPDPDTAAALPVDASPDGLTRLGRFRVIRLLGSGGFGLVYLAWDESLRREVALKVPRPHAVIDPESRHSVLREAWNASRLSHPNLIPLYDAGRLGSVVYLVLEYCPGPTLAGWLRQRGRPAEPEAAAALLADLAGAIDYMHNRGIIHRDLKPGNILLSSREPAGDDPAAGPLSWYTPRVTDFGLAKDLWQTQPTTGTGYRAGTPQYMAPEQAAGRRTEVGPTTDVWALGVILYELLTGRPPFLGDSDADVLTRIERMEPVPPRRLQSAVPRDLETICLKCLEKEPGKRYPSAKELGDDLHRCLTGRAIHARRPGRVERLRRWGVRNRSTVATSSAVGLAVVLLALAVWRGSVVLRERERHQHEAAAAAYQRGLELCEQGEVAPGLLWMADALEKSPESAGELRRRVRQDIGAYARHVPVLRAHLTHPRRVWAFEFSPDSRTLLTVCHDNIVRLWNTAPGSPGPASLKVPRLWGATFRPDGRAVWGIDLGGLVRAWATDTGVSVYRPAFAGPPRPVPADRMWELTTGRPPPPSLRSAGNVWRLALSPDRKSVLTIALDGACEVELFDAATGESRGKLPHGKSQFLDAAFSPDGKTVVTGSDAGVACLWDVATQRPLATLPPHPTSVHSVAFSPDGRTVATGDKDAIRFWAVADGKAELLLTVPKQGDVRTLAFSPDGRWLAAGSGENHVRLWELPGAGMPPVLDHAGSPVLAVAFDPTGDAVVTGTGDSLPPRPNDRLASIWVARTGQRRLQLAGHTAPVQSVAWWPGGAVATGGRDRTLRLWNTGDGSPVRPPIPHPDWVNSVTFSGDGRTCYTACLDGVVRGWELATGRPGLDFSHGDAVFGLGLTRDGSRFLTGSQKRGASLWTGDGTLLLQLPHPDSVSAVSLDPDGRVAVTGSKDGTVRFWDTETGACLASHRAHLGRVCVAAHSPDGRLVVTGGHDRTVRFWDAATHSPTGPATVFPSDVNAAAFHPGGRTLLVGCKDGTARHCPVPAAAEGTPERIRLWVEAAAGVEWDPGRGVRTLDPAGWTERRQRLGDNGAGDGP